MNRLITALSIAGPDDVDVPFILDGYRSIQRVEGLAGVRVRKAKRPRTGRNGSVDRTRFRDDAAVVITGLVRGEDADRAWEEYDALTRALVGAVDTNRLMKWTAGTSRLLQMNVRLDEMQAPVEVGPDLIKYQVTLTGPDPNGYSQTEKVATGTPLASSDGGGLVAPLVAPLVGNPSAGGDVAIDNAGTAPTPPYIVLSGYLRNPIVQLGDRRLVFDGEIADGHTLHIDATSNPRSVLLDGSADRLGMLVFEESRWFDLPTGDSTVTLLAEDFAGGAGIEVRYHDAYE